LKSAYKAFILPVFISTPHFSRCYRKHIGVSPRDERKIAWKAEVSDAPSFDKGAFLYIPHAQDALSHSYTEPSYGSVAV
jgi:AraC-like DNA-binding protein